MWLLVWQLVALADVYKLLLLQVLIPEYAIVLERIGHSATAVTINPSLIEVTIFGGCRHFDFFISEEEQLMLAGTTVLKFGMLLVNKINYTHP